MMPVLKTMNLIGIVLGLTWSVLSEVSGQVIKADMTTELTECAQLLSNTTGDTSLTNDISDDVYIQCLREFVWKENNVQWSKVNITKEDKGFINSLISSLVQRNRQKRRAGHRPIYPGTGSRTRQEYRVISEKARHAFHHALNIMKKAGTYDVFAKIHRGIVVQSAHFGPNFFSWHRVFIAMFEEALRRIIPWLSLPYWDCTLDYDMKNPVHSIIWTKAFLGSGHGHVRNGPFANWMAAGGPLTRNIGGRSTLLSKQVIRRIMTRCRTSDITFPNAKLLFDFEYHHGGPHLWMGGQMSGLNTAGYDPAFWLYHAFIDYIWELFRIHQAKFCGVNPTMDYPKTKGLHAADRQMDSFQQYRNIDGYSSFWTEYWYRYEPSPSCSMRKPFCGSRYLRCDKKRHRCVSMARPPPYPGYGAAMRARAEEAKLKIGPLFRGPKSEPRTYGFQMRMASGRFRRAANQNMASKQSKQKNNTPSSPSYDPVYKAPAFDGVYRDFTKSSMSSVTSASVKLLPVPDYHEPSLKDMFRPPVQNTFVLNGHADITKWAFIPVSVSFKNKSTEKRCKQDETGAMQVRIQSSGLNYDGEYFGYTLIDRHLPADSATTYIGIKSPEVEYTEVILSAVHSCGLMCQAHCLIPESVPATFKPCSGVLKISNKEPNVYSRTYEEAVSRVLQESVTGGGKQDENKSIFFDCSDVLESPKF